MNDGEPPLDGDSDDDSENEEEEEMKDGGPLGS